MEKRGKKRRIKIALRTKKVKWRPYCEYCADGEFLRVEAAFWFEINGKKTWLCRLHRLWYTFFLPSTPKDTNGNWVIFDKSKRANDQEATLG